MCAHIYEKKKKNKTRDITICIYSNVSSAGYSVNLFQQTRLRDTDTSVAVDVRRSEIQRLISTGDSCNRVSENNTIGFNRRTRKIRRSEAEIFVTCDMCLGIKNVICLSCTPFWNIFISLVYFYICVCNVFTSLKPSRLNNLFKIIRCIRFSGAISRESIAFFSNLSSFHTANLSCGERRAPQ